jgi:Cu-Zn family superoxide dismutase
MKKVKPFVSALALSVIPLTSMADMVVPMNLVDDKGLSASIGQVVISESPYGLAFSPAITNMPPGLRRA